MFKPKIKARQPESFEKAYDYAMYLLNLQLRTSGELESKMKDKGYTYEAIHKVLAELATNRYIDDQRYAEVYLENLKKYKTFGFYGIKKKLMEKRLSNSLIEKVLGEGLGVEEEIKIAKRFIKKHSSLGVIPSASEESRAVRKTETLLQINRNQDDAGVVPLQGSDNEYRKYEKKQKPRNSFDKGKTDGERLAQKLRARGFRSEIIMKVSAY